MLNNKETYIAKTIFGLESVLAEELIKIGAQDVITLNRAVQFTADKQVLYKANLYARTAIRILKPLVTFNVKNSDSLYKGAHDVSWQMIFSAQDTFMVSAVVNHEEITHSHYAALKVKDAIVDRFREDTGIRPSVDTENPDFRIHAHIDENQCTLLLDSSGDSLYKRGYRLAATEAPMNEVLAAGLLLLTGYDGSKPLMDPMCGSGTFLIEAAMIALNIPPTLHRNKFGFQSWKNFDNEIWQQVKEDAFEDIKDIKLELYGCDISPIAVSKARKNIDAAGLSRVIDLQTTSFFTYTKPFENGILVMNPPYGEKLAIDDIMGLYKEIGDTLKKSYSGFEAWIISSNFSALKNIGLQTSRKIKVFNGAIECRFCKYELYQGSRKTKYQQEEK